MGAERKLRPQQDFCYRMWVKTEGFELDMSRENEDIHLISSLGRQQVSREYMRELAVETKRWGGEEGYRSKYG